MEDIRAIVSSKFSRSYHWDYKTRDMDATINLILGLLVVLMWRYKAGSFKDMFKDTLAHLYVCYMLVMTCVIMILKSRK